ncbi:MAG: nucleotidyltransferase family protein, partial [Pseudomonadota bacterium]
MGIFLTPDAATLVQDLFGLDGGATPEIDSGMFDTLATTADREGMAPRLYALHGAPGRLPNEFRERLRRSAIESEALELQRRPALAELLDALANRQIPALLMKGAALAYTLYPSPGLRPRSDTDILIPESAAAPARARLETLGFNLSESAGTTTLSYQFTATRQLPGGSPDVVDVHHRLSNRAAFSRLF